MRSTWKEPVLFLAISLMASCDLPSTHLPAAHWGDGDGGAPDTRQVSADARANAIPRDSGGNGPCQQQTIDLTIPKGDVMLLVERSSMMNTSNACNNCGTCWTTLVSAVDALTTASSNHFRWGLKLFPPPSDSDACSVSQTVDLPLATSANAAIVSALASTVPNGQTPTTLAVHQVFSYFSTVQNASPKFVVLAVAGTPTCGAGDPAQEDLAAAIAEVGRLDTQFVFALGLGPGPERFDKLAIAGGTVSTYAPDQIDYLRMRLERLAMVSASCVFPMPAAPVPGQSVSVLLDDAPLVANGWDGFTVSTDGTQLTLQGSPCFYIGAHSSLSIKVGCGN